MTQAFGSWNDKIAAATDERARRALLGQIGVWRAQRLVDLAAQRDAAYALSVVYHQLGEQAQAAHEAEQLLALCRTAPVPPPEAMRFAERHAREVGGRSRAPQAPRDDRRPERGDRGERRDRPDRAARPERGERPGRPERQARPERGDRPARPAPQPGRPPVQDDAAWAKAEAAVAARRWNDAREAVAGRKGARASMFRTWTRLAEALDLGIEARDLALRQLERELAARFAAGAVDDDEAPARAERAPRERAPKGGVDVVDSPLAAALGRPVPSDRDELLAAMEARVAADPASLDAVAAGALRDHVARFGRAAVAPWLVGTTGAALASGDAPQTKAALSELGDAYAVTAYREPVFGFLVEALREATARGATAGQIRRGVLRRGVPPEHQIWTLRVVLDGAERLLAATSPSEAPMDAELADRLAERVAHLADRALLVAPGAGHAALRRAAEVAGLPVLDEADAASAVDRLAAVEARATAPVPPVGDAALPDPLASIASLFRAPEPSDVDAYTPHVGRLSRAWRTFLPLRQALEEMAAHEIDRRLPALLSAVHAVAPEGVRLAEGISVALRAAAAVPGGAVDLLLRGGDDVAQRFGAPGIVGLVDVIRALREDGWTVRRTLLGVTRRERRSQPGLDPIADAVHGLWRLVIRKDDRQGELWWLASPSPEARAAVPLLLLEPYDRVVVVPEGSGLESWIPAGGAPVIVWSGAEGDALKAAVATWPPRADAGAADGDDEA